MGHALLRMHRISYGNFLEFKCWFPVGICGNGGRTFSSLRFADLEFSWSSFSPLAEIGIVI